MGSYQHERSQMPCYFQHYLPGSGFLPLHMKVDQTKAPTPNESWPCFGNYGYPGPCHACCNHGYFPSYCNFRPHYPLHLPQPPYYSVGGYPIQPDVYPVQYAPPPHYTMEQPRYEYDKDAPKNNHCCGCPNHLYSMKEGGGVKIEEEEQDVQKKSSGALIPAEQKYNSRPFVWFPPDFLRRKDSLVPPESDLKDHERRENEASDGSYPFNSCKNGECGKIAQTQKEGQQKGQIPIPIIWMPSNELDEPEREESKQTDSLPSKFGNGSLNVQGSHDGMGNLSTENGNAGWAKKTEKNVRTKEIPVKQLYQHEDNKPSDGAKGRTRDIAVKPMKANEEEKVSVNGVQRHSSSSPKASKLPPVCLRVDRLPRRKNGNDNSRSPSPPGNKGKCSQDMLNGPTNVSGSEDNTQKALQGSDRTVHSQSGDIKDISQSQVPVDLLTNFHKDAEKNDPELGVEVATPVEASKAGNSVYNAELGDTKTKTGEDNSARGEEGQKSAENIKSEKQCFSPTEAAVKIQSAYRRYEVQKWDPLKKLKQIDEVRLQVADVRAHIEALESSDAEIDKKERVVIGETIMSLLLKLDTVQSLHPTVREIRKAVSRELIRLQERLDALAIKNLEGFDQNLPIKDPCKCTLDDGTQEQNEHSKEFGNESNCDPNFYANNGCQGCEEASKSMVHYANDGCQGGEEASKSTLVDSLHGEVDNSTNEVDNIDGEVKPQMSEFPLLRSEVGAGNKKPNVSFTEEGGGEVDRHSQLVLSDGAPSLAGEKINSDMEFMGPLCRDMSGLSKSQSTVVGADDSIPVHGAVEPGQLVEPPQGENSEELIPMEPAKHEESGRRDVLRDKELVSSSIAGETISGEPLVAHSEDHSVMNQLVQQTKDDFKGVVWREKSQALLVEENCENMQIEQRGNISAEYTPPAAAKEVALIEKPEEGSLSESENRAGQNSGNMVGALEEEKIPNEATEEEGMSALVKVVAETTEAGATKDAVSHSTSVGEQADKIELIKNDEINCEAGLDPRNEHEASLETDFGLKISGADGHHLEVQRNNDKLIEENKKLRETMEKLIEAGKDQLTQITNLNGRVKHLERKLSRKKKLRTRPHRAGAPRPPFSKPC